MKVAIYIRVSTDEQAKEGISLEEQQERLVAYCKANGWKDYTLYIDDGYSAKTTARPEFQRMMGDIRAKRIEIVVTTKIDRLTRRLIDLLSFIEELDKYDCHFKSSTESFDTSTPVGRMVLQLLGVFAEFERERNAERVKDNMVHMAKFMDQRKGKAISRACYGYDIVDKTYVVNPQEAEVVQQMAEMVLQGIGSRRIAASLNERGIPTKSGSQWYDRVIRELLRRETLIGTFVWNKTTTKGKKVVPVPEEQWIRHYDHHEPILSKETFEAVQQAMDARKASGANKHVDNSRYLLSGLLRCGHCGGPMVGRVFTQRPTKTHPSPKVRYAYICNAYAKQGTCFYHYTDRDPLEATVINKIKALTESFDYSAKVVKRKSTEAMQEELEARLENIERRSQRQIEAWEKELITDEDLINAKKRIEKERKEILEALQPIYCNKKIITVNQKSPSRLLEIKKTFSRKLSLNY
ncbi:recombinase family protein [Brevibacillus laterosporus]|uniref:recombinase family protein n=1 Tax=Brevibacillus laterosporus TaxID=1465 RepID=UPI0018F88AA3|nr:recombinase family protein [Brevibacillus laterosporus]